MERRWLVVALGILMLWGIVCSCALADDKSDYARAEKYYATGDYYRARECLLQIPIDSPLVTKAKHLAAMCLYKRKMFPTALGELDALRRGFPQSDAAGDCLYWMGICADLDRKPDAALEYFARQSREYPHNAMTGPALLKLGEHYVAKGEYSNAFALYERVVKLYFKDYADDAVLQTGICRQTMKEYETAIDVFISMLRGYPNSDRRVDAITHIGECLMAIGLENLDKKLYDKAWDCFAEVVDKHPETMPARPCLGYMGWMIGKRDGDKAELDFYMAQMNKHPELWVRGRWLRYKTYERMEQIEAGLEELHKAFQEKPQDDQSPDCWVRWWLDTFPQHEKDAEAIAEAERIVDLHPNDIWTAKAALQLHSLYFDLWVKGMENKIANASDYLEKGREVLTEQIPKCSNAGTWLISMKADLGYDLGQMGDHRGSIEALQQVLNEHADGGSWVEMLCLSIGSSYLQLRDFTNARWWCQECLNRSPAGSSCIPFAKRELDLIATMEQETENGRKQRERLEGPK